MTGRCIKNSAYGSVSVPYDVEWTAECLCISGDD